MSQLIALTLFICVGFALAACLAYIFYRAHPKSPPISTCFFDGPAIQAPKDIIRMVQTETDLLQLSAQENIRVGTYVFVKRTGVLYKATITGGWRKVQSND
jgi:hypothetical protein